jgi:glycerol kinase
LRNNDGYILSIDQGTSGTTILLVNTKGESVYKYYQSFPQSYPKPGWVEHDPEVIWQTVSDGIKEILALSWLQEEQIKAIGITNQRETVVVWDRQTGLPVYPAIVWQCRRTANFCAQLTAEGLNTPVTEKTGLRLDPYFSATKIRWILDHVAGVRERAQKGELACGTIDSWLIWKLTGGLSHVTDYSNACRTLLLNIHTRQWDTELLQEFDLPLNMLPEVKSSVGFLGETDTTLFSRRRPITGVLGDQQAALFGQGCLEPGMIKNTYGTGCFMLMNTGEKCFLPEYGLLTSIGWVVNNETTYVLEGSVFTGGALVKWLRDELGIIKEAAETENLAKKVSNTNDVYFVPAFTGLGTPHWDPYARGIIIGLTCGTTKEHLVRAALEGIAYQVKEVVDSMTKITGCKPECLRVDGGAAANNFLLQFQSDVCGLPIQRNNSLELTGLGAAFCAGLGVGLWSDVDEIKNLVKMEQLFKPEISASVREKLCANWLRAVERAKGWVGSENA